MKIRNLKSPPIAEALILVIPDLQENVTQQQLVTIKDQLLKQYPEVVEKKLNSLSFSVKENKASFENTEKTQGFELSDSNRKVVIQIDPDKLVISRLAPYKDGDELVELCNNISRIYLAELDSQKIKHLALRYINKMNVWSNKIEDHIKVKVSLNSEKKDLHAYKVASRFNVYSPDCNAGGVIHYVIDVPDDPKSDKECGILLDVIFDIDVYKTNIPIPEGNRFDSELKRLRDFKNEIFFENVDEELLKEYEK